MGVLAVHVAQGCALALRNSGMLQEQSSMLRGFHVSIIAFGQRVSMCMLLCTMLQGIGCMIMNGILRPCRMIQKCSTAAQMHIGYRDGHASACGSGIFRTRRACAVMCRMCGHGTCKCRLRVCCARIALGMRLVYVSRGRRAVRQADSLRGAAYLSIVTLHRHLLRSSV